MKFMNFRNGLIVSLFSIVGLQAVSTFRVGGYYEAWAFWRKNNGAIPDGTYPSAVPAGFTPILSNNGATSSINIVNYCFSTFNYSVVGFPGPQIANAITGDWAIKYVDPAHDPVWVGQLAGNKVNNPNLKIMLSIGGWSFCVPSSVPAPDSYPATSDSYGDYTYPFFSNLLAAATADRSTGPAAQFIQSVVTLVTTKGQNGAYLADGIDLDYEYPGVSRGARQAAGPDYQGFIDLITGLRTALDLAAASRGVPCYISMTIPPFFPTGAVAGSWLEGSYPKGTNSFDGENVYSAGAVNPADPSTYFAWMSIVANLCDWVNLMSYDMYGAKYFPNTANVQYQAPLYNGVFQKGFTPSSSTTPTATLIATTFPNETYNGQINQAYSIAYALWMWTYGAGFAKEGETSITGVGIPLSKINLGLAAYGRSYGSAASASIGAAYSGEGAKQRYTQSPGVAAYYEIVPMIENAGYINRFSHAANYNIGAPPVDDTVLDQSLFYFDSSTTNIPLAPAVNAFVYDSLADVSAKTAYAQQVGLGGVFLYPLTQDNLSGSSAQYDFSKSLILQVLSNLKSTGPSPSGANLTNRTAN